MSPAPLWPALSLALLLLASAATPAPQQKPARGRLNTLTYANSRTTVGGRERVGRTRDGGGSGGSDFGRFLGIVTGPQLQLLGPQYFAQTGTLAQVAALAGADLVLPLFESSVGASSGGYGNPAAQGTADSSEEVADLEV